MFVFFLGDSASVRTASTPLQLLIQASHRNRIISCLRRTMREVRRSFDEYERRRSIENLVSDGKTVIVFSVILSRIPESASIDGINVLEQTAGIQGGS